jgi:Carboxypeptidase regulatory-like domain
MNTKLRFFAVLLAVTLTIAWSIPSVGQVLKGSISGTVVDPQGAVVSGATVRVTNIETGVVNTTTSDSSGMFRLNLIPAGTYTVEVGAQGFKTASSKGVAVVAGGDSGMGSVRLSVGETSTTVDVSAAAPLIEVTQAQITNTFAGTTLSTFAGIQENEGLDRMALFVPGVVNSRMDNFSNTNGGVGFSVAGVRGRNNDQEIDGQNNNDNSVGGPALSVSDVNFVSQYVLITNNFGPEYGRNGGSVVNVITKQGTNAWHGSVYGSEETSYLDALNNLQRQTLTPSGAPVFTGPPRFNREFTGGSIGGPIVKNKAFLFSGFDDQLFSGNTSSTSNSLTPTPAGLATLAGCPGVNATAIAFLSKFGPYAFSAGNPTPVNPSLSTLGGCPLVQIGGVTRTLSTPAHQFNWIERADWQLGGDSIMGRYLFRRNNTFNNNDNAAGGWVQNTTALSQAVLLSWTHSFTSRMVNEARVSFDRINVQFGGNSIGNPFEPTDAHIGEALANISFQTGGALSVGPATNLPQGRIVNTWQGQDNWNYVLGKHNLKAGVNWTYQRSPNIFLPNINGQFRFFSLGQFLGGCATCGTGLTPMAADVPNRIIIGNGPSLNDFREYDTFAYVGDDWKVSQNLTLNLGVTWTYYGQPANLFNEVSLARESNPSTAFWNPAVPLASRVDPQVPAVTNSFGPSAGFAYSPQWGGFLTGHGKTVIRGGYRLLYDPPFYNIFLNVSTSAPFVFLQTLTPAQSAANPLLAVPTGPNVRAQLASSIARGAFDPRTFTQTIVDPNFGPDKIHSWSFGFEREVTKNSALEVRYVGNHAVNLFQTVDGNPYVGTATAPGLAQSFPNLVPAGVTACTTPTTILGPGQTVHPELGRASCNAGVVGSRNNGGFSNYQGLQVEFRANNLFKQLTLRTGYTWSKNLDNTSEIFSTLAGGNTLTIAQNPFNTTTGEYSISGLNVPHAWTIQFTEELPFFKEQHGLVGHLLGGWLVEGSYVLASGQPYTPFQLGEAIATTPFGNVYDSSFTASFGSGIDSARPFYGSLTAPANTVGIFASDMCRTFFGVTPAADPLFQRPGACNTLVTAPNALLSFNSLNNNPKSPKGGFLTGPGTQFSKTDITVGQVAPVTTSSSNVRFIINGGIAQQLFGTPFGNVPRNALSDAIQNTANASVAKVLKLSERSSFEFRLTVVNALNHFNFSGVDPELENAGRSAFGVGFANPALSTANGRQVFLAGKFTF